MDKSTFVLSLVRVYSGILCNNLKEEGHESGD